MLMSLALSLLTTPFDFLSKPPSERVTHPGGGPDGSGGLALPGNLPRCQVVELDVGASVSVHRPGGSKGPSSSETLSSLTLVSGADASLPLGDLSGLRVGVAAFFSSLLRERLLLLLLRSFFFVFFGLDSFGLAGSSSFSSLSGVGPLWPDGSPPLLLGGCATCCRFPRSQLPARE